MRRQPETTDKHRAIKYYDSRACPIVVGSMSSSSSSVSSSRMFINNYRGVYQIGDE